MNGFLREHSFCSYCYYIKSKDNRNSIKPKVVQEFLKPLGTCGTYSETTTDIPARRFEFNLMWFSLK